MEPLIIQHWDWDGTMQGDIALPASEDYVGSIFIEKDSESILFRTFKRKTQAAELAAKNTSNDKNSVNDKNSSIIAGPIHKMTVKQLKETSKKVGLKITGSKNELQTRLGNYISK